MPLTAGEIREAYELVLGRVPESHDVVAEHARNFSTLPSFWKALLLSEEFQQRTETKAQGPADMGSILRVLHDDGSSVQHTVPAEALEKLTDRVRKQWTQLGEVDPHWSVLVQDEFRSDRMTEASQRAFNDSGAAMAQLVDLFERRTGSVFSRGVCLELGCGTGRITRHLAEMFDQVIAVDISAGNLGVCASYLETEGVCNVELRLIEGPHDFESLPLFDFFFSVIVLQHNPPPVQKFVLETILNRIRPGGGALFQIPSSLEHYAFSLDRYLDSAEPVMEMHCLPSSVVLKIVREAGLALTDVCPDPFIGHQGSNLYSAVKAPAAE